MPRKRGSNGRYRLQPALCTYTLINGCFARYNVATLRRLIRNGDESGALELYRNNSSDLQGSTFPSQSLGDRHGNDTLLHWCLEAGMVELLREFLARGGDPTARNDNDETGFHACVKTRLKSRKPKRRGGKMTGRRSGEAAADEQHGDDEQRATCLLVLIGRRRPRQRDLELGVGTRRN